MKELAHERGCDHLEISCEWHNDDARRFYRDMDFQPKQVEYINYLNDPRDSFGTSESAGLPDAGKSNRRVAAESIFSLTVAEMTYLRPGRIWGNEYIKRAPRVVEGVQSVPEDSVMSDRASHSGHAGVPAVRPGRAKKT